MTDSSRPARRPYVGSLKTSEIAGNALAGRSVLITGGTGSFGRQFVATALEHANPRRLIVLSRDEVKQAEMAQQFGHDPRLRFFLGDVRDRDRLRRAFRDVDVVVHAAALKQVPAAEYNPFEFIKTNVIGAEHVVDAALDAGVGKVVALSTDKAANPINLYGASKLCADKLFVAANSYSGASGTRFTCVRYGNVVASRGSVIPFFLSRKSSGVLPITHPDMTRFWITLEQGVTLVFAADRAMHGGEIFVPKIPSMRLVDLARAIAPECRLDVVGVRPGEKLHETMVPEDDARNAFEYEDCFVIRSLSGEADGQAVPNSNGGRPCPEGFRYSSDNNSQWLTVPELQKLVNNVA